MSAPRAFPLRWVSRQERAWNDNAVFEACIDLLEHEALAHLSPVQRVAHLAFHADRSLQVHGWAHFARATPPALRREIATAFEGLGASAQAAWLRAASAGEPAVSYAQLTPSLEAKLREYLDTHEASFVRESRPSCTS